MTDDHRNVGRAVGVVGVGDPHLIAARGGQIRNEARRLPALVGVVVVVVAGVDVDRMGRAPSVEPAALRVEVVHHDAREIAARLARDGYEGRTLEVEHLAVRKESRLQARGVDFLHVYALLDRVDSGGGGALPEHHEHRLHADAAVGDVRRAQADGHEQVDTLGRAGADAAEADRVGAHAHLHIAFVADEALLCNVPLHVVGVHVVRTHADAVGHDLGAHAIALGHDVVADHAAGLAHIELPRPVVVVRELVAGEAKALELGPHFLRHARVVGQRPHQTLLPVDMRLSDALAFGVAGLGVVPVLADEVGADGVVVVRVGLAVGHPNRVPRDARVAGLEVPQEQLVPARVVVGGLLPRAAVFRHVGGAQAEVVGLHLAIAGKLLARTLGVDAGQEAAGSITGFHVRVDGPDELVAHRAAGLHAVQGLAVG